MGFNVMSPMHLKAKRARRKYKIKFGVAYYLLVDIVRSVFICDWMLTNWWTNIWTFWWCSFKGITRFSCIFERDLNSIQKPNIYIGTSNMVWIYAFILCACIYKATFMLCVWPQKKHRFKYYTEWNWLNSVKICLHLLHGISFRTPFKCQMVFCV